MNAPLKLRYPRKSEIERVVLAAKSCGLDVAGFEVSPDGTIRIMEARGVMDLTDFDRFSDRL